MQYAAYYCWRSSGHEAAVKACRFLLDMGAHAEWEDEIGKYVLPSTFRGQKSYLAC